MRKRSELPRSLRVVATREPHRVSSPNGTRENDYHWLHDGTRKNRKMLAYRNAEAVLGRLPSYLRLHVLLVGSP
jgi:hypothetical protein